MEALVEVPGPLLAYLCMEKYDFELLNKASIHFGL